MGWLSGTAGSNGHFPSWGSRWLYDVAMQESSEVVDFAVAIGMAVNVPVDCCIVTV